MKLFKIKQRSLLITKKTIAYSLTSTAIIPSPYINPIASQQVC
ncbi:hypothetical protein [Pseudanabaena sp. UWO310]|nr:hypothetical protein [Pseudanabaena sp. UWO310]